MYQTRERIFPDEFETRCDLGNFEQHGRTQAVQEKDDPQRRARKQLAVHPAPLRFFPVEAGGGAAEGRPRALAYAHPPEEGG